MEEYKRTLSDELNWNQINQLHNATLGLSKQSFEIKKICLTLEVASLTLIAKFVENDLDTSLFIAGLIIPLVFLFLDALTYFYQDRLRGLMVTEENKIRTRHNQNEKENKHSYRRIIRSIFNSSHLIYLILIILDIVLGVCLGIY